ncbi:hypothetical protein GW17_00060979 [Ensete ventricosum]|nr:hypothetical protein GW17_00060979 [Ensete ventricosum]
MQHLENSKFKQFPTYLPLGSCTSLVSRKNTTVYKLCAKLSFHRFFMLHLKNSKYWPFPTY